MICEEIMKVLEQQSPENCACSWDNVGLLAGNSQKEIQRIYIALDATDEAIAEAIEHKADMILTHHPLIFKGLRKINDRDFIGRRIIHLIQNDIAYYAMHTNFDILGMADLAAERMELLDTAVLQPELERDGEVLGIGKVGMLKDAVSLKECIAKTKQAFGVVTVKVFGWDEKVAETKTVRRIAICPGSGKSVIEGALKQNAEVLITGDIDHHEGIDALARGMVVIDAGHYGVEKLFVPYMQAYLEKKLQNVEIIVQAVKEPFAYI